MQFGFIVDTIENILCFEYEHYIVRIRQLDSGVFRDYCYSRNYADTQGCFHFRELKLPSLKEMKQLSFRLINGQAEIVDIAKLFVESDEEWPFSRFIQLLKEHNEIPSKKLEQDIFRLAHVIAAFDTEQCRNELFEYLQFLQNTESKDSMETAQVIHSFAKNYDHQDIMLMIHMAVDEYEDINLPEESRPLFSSELLAQFDERKKELELFYREDIVKAHALCCTRIPKMLNSLSE